MSYKGSKMKNVNKWRLENKKGFCLFGCLFNLTHLIDWLISVKT